MVSQFGSCRRAAFAIPPASHLNWRGKRVLTQASYPTLDAARCGVKVIPYPSSRNSGLPIGAAFSNCEATYSLITPAIDTCQASTCIPHLASRRADQNRCRFLGRRSRFDIVMVEGHQDIRLRILGRD